jgi:hypothetical protein
MPFIFTVNASHLYNLLHTLRSWHHHVHVSNDEKLASSDSIDEKQRKRKLNARHQSQREHLRSLPTHFIVIQGAYLASANPLSTYAFLETNRNNFSSHVSATIIDHPPYISPSQFFESFATVAASPTSLSMPEYELLSQRERASLSKLNSALKRHRSQSCILLFETVLGAGGVWMLTSSFLYECRKLCDKHKALIVVDEVLTGCGRTGAFFAYEHYEQQSFMPDYVMIGKALFLSAIVLVRRAFAVVDDASNDDNGDDVDDEGDDDTVVTDAMHAVDKVDDDDNDDNGIAHTRKRIRVSSSSSSSSASASASASASTSSTSHTCLSPYNVDTLFAAIDEFREHVTFECNALMFLQASILLERIRSGDLISNARTTGQHILERMRLIERSKQLPPADMVCVQCIRIALACMHPIHPSIHPYIHTSIVHACVVLCCVVRWC